MKSIIDTYIFNIHQIHQTQHNKITKKNLHTFLINIFYIKYVIYVYNKNEYENRSKKIIFIRSR